MSIHNQVLYFSNFNLKENTTQVTVRRGVKWAVLNPGDIVFTTSNSNETPFYNGFIKVVDVKVFKFCDIPLEILNKEHDDNCKTIEGLFDEMKKVYGSNFDYYEIVTVIEFEYHETNKI